MRYIEEQSSKFHTIIKIMKLFKKNLPKEVELFVRKVAVHVTFIIIIQHQFRILD